MLFYYILGFKSRLWYLQLRIFRRVNPANKEGNLYSKVELITNPPPCPRFCSARLVLLQMTNALRRGDRECEKKKKTKYQRLKFINNYTFLKWIYFFETIIFVKASPNQIENVRGTFRSTVKLGYTDHGYNELSL